MEKLKRMNLVVPEEGFAALAAKASKVLGYTGAMAHSNIADKLGLQLIELDIKPYDKQRVIAYKEKKRKEAHAARKAKVHSYTRVTSGWKLVPISKYTESIPEFILNKAIQIKEHCPEAGIFVDVLRVNTKRIPDPFLVVQLGFEKYWIEVWDEEEFEREL